MAFCQRIKRGYTYFTLDFYDNIRYIRPAVGPQSFRIRVLTLPGKQCRCMCNFETRRLLVSVIAQLI